jgi:hypothetical protein
MTGNQKTFRIPVSSGLLEHCAEMGEAIWLFLWYIDKTTKEKTNGSGDTLGAVLGGMPCRDSDAADALGISRRQIGRWRSHLTAKNYIETTRTPVGYSIKVKKSKKWIVKGSDKNVVSLLSDTTNMSHPSEESDRTKTVVDTTKTVVDGQNVHIQYRQDRDSTETKQKEREEGPPSLAPLSRFDFASDFDIPAENFLEIWPCPESEPEAYGWLDHVRMRLGDALGLRNLWAWRYFSKRENPEILTDSTLEERAQQIQDAMASISETEQLVRDAIQDFEDAGFSLAEYHKQSTLRLYATKQVFDSGHTY